MSTANDPWGRVDADGTVYVRTAEGERVIGSWQAGSPEEALAFYRRKFEALNTEPGTFQRHSKEPSAQGWFDASATRVTGDRVAFTATPMPPAITRAKAAIPSSF